MMGFSPFVRYLYCQVQEVCKWDLLSQFGCRRT